MSLCIRDFQFHKSRFSQRGIPIIIILVCRTFYDFTIRHHVRIGKDIAFYVTRRNSHVTEHHGSRRCEVRAVTLLVLRKEIANIIHASEIITWAQGISIICGKKSRDLLCNFLWCSRKPCLRTCRGNSLSTKSRNQQVPIADRLPFPFWYSLITHHGIVDIALSPKGFLRPILSWH